MPEPRSFSDEQASRLEKLYADADEQITKQIGIYEASGRAPGTTRNLKQLLSNVRKIRADVLKGARTWTDTTIGSSKGPGIAYKAGMEWADKGIPAASEILPGFFNIHQQAALKIADEIYGRFDEVDQTIDKSVRTVARRIDDVYRQMTLAKAQKSVLGQITARQAAKDLKKELLEKGITGFVDKAGRHWKLETYTRMAAITTTNNCLREGTINRIQERGHDLVIVSSHSGSCPKCSPWNGKTLSISGEDPDYPSLADARANSLFHPRCKHAVSLSPVAKDRFIEKLQGKQGEAARQAEIARLAEKAGWKSVASETPKYDAFMRARSDYEAARGRLKSLPSANWGQSAPVLTPAQKQLKEGLNAQLADIMKNDSKMARAAYEELLGIAKRDFPTIQFSLESKSGFIDPKILHDSIQSIRRVHNEYPKAMPSSLSVADIGEGTYAQIGVRRLDMMINDKLTSYKSRSPFTSMNPNQLEKDLDANEKSGFHPIGCNTWEGVITHELGHAVEEVLSKSPKFAEKLKSFNESNKIVSGLSEYAKVGNSKGEYNERFAEAFESMYHTPSEKQCEFVKEFRKFLAENARE